MNKRILGSKLVPRVMAFGIKDNSVVWEGLLENISSMPDGSVLVVSESDEKIIRAVLNWAGHDIIDYAPHKSKLTEVPAGYSTDEHTRD
jgi:hypothetical protein